MTSDLPLGEGGRCRGDSAGCAFGAPNDLGRAGCEYGQLSFLHDPFIRAKQGIFFFSASVLVSLMDDVGEGDREVGEAPLDPFSLLPLPLPLPLGLADGVAERARSVMGPGTASPWLNTQRSPNLQLGK